MLEFATPKFTLNKFKDIIWGFSVEIKTDCQALWDILVSIDLNTTHTSVIAHHIMDIHHIPGCMNLVGDGIIHKDECKPWQLCDSSEWSVTPDWETTRGLTYDLFTITDTPTGPQCQLHEHFKDENVFIEVIDGLFGIENFSLEQDHTQAKHKAEGYMIEDGKLWRLGGQAVSDREYDQGRGH